MLVEISGAEWLGMPNHVKAYFNPDGLIVLFSDGEFQTYDWEEVIYSIVPCMDVLLTPSTNYDHIVFNWSNRYGEYVFHCHKFYPYLSNSGENTYIEVTFSEALKDGWLDEYGTLASDYEFFTRMPLFARYQSNVRQRNSDDSVEDLVTELVELASVEFDFNGEEARLKGDGIFSVEMEYPITMYPQFSIENVLEQREEDLEISCNSDISDGQELFMEEKNYNECSQHGPIAGNPLRMPDLNEELTQTSKI